MIIVYLEDENGKREKKVLDTLMIIPKIVNSLNDHEIKLWGYIDLYGDTVFNYLQCKDLIRDSVLLTGHLNHEENVLLQQMIDLIREAQNDRHMYIRFFGD